MIRTFAQFRTIVEAILVLNAEITTTEVAAMSDIELATYILALNGRFVVSADEAQPTLQ